MLYTSISKKFGEKSEHSVWKKAKNLIFKNSNPLNYWDGFLAPRVKSTWLPLPGFVNLLLFFSVGWLSWLKDETSRLIFHRMCNGLRPPQKNPFGINDTKMKIRRLRCGNSELPKETVNGFRISLASVLLTEQIYSKRDQLALLSVFCCSSQNIWRFRDERLFKGFLKVKEERKRKKISSYNKERRR